MFYKIYIKLLVSLIDIIDSQNKKKVVNFFKSKFINKNLVIIDVGAHKGETVDLFLSKLNIKKIFSLEPNSKLYELLVNKKKNYKENIQFYNLGLGNINENKNLNIFQDTSSSTFNSINVNSKYFKKKNKIMTFFSNSKSFFENNQNCKILKTSDFVARERIEYINILKIDTEGYEYNILRGLEQKDFQKIDYIYFEHHYDLMLNKNYKFKDINEILLKNNFKISLKLKMKFRKTFEYIYERSKI